MRIEIENWWKQAQKDLEAAGKNREIEEYYLVAFLCHQAVEKGLKALIMLKRKERFIPTHSLVELGKKAEVNQRLMQDLRVLAPDYTLSRYPDVAASLPYENYDEEIAADRLTRARRIFTWLNTLMQ